MYNNIRKEKKKKNVIPDRQPGHDHVGVVDCLHLVHLIRNLNILNLKGQSHEIVANLLT